jgi:hypothetical protein
LSRLLPEREHAFIPQGKLTGYLLSMTHSVGKSKAKFFRELGFNEQTVDELERLLLRLAQTSEVSEEITTVHGVNYVIIGDMETPVGRTVRILSVWIIDTGAKIPRFVTARPFKQANGEPSP